MGLLGEPQGSLNKEPWEAGRGCGPVRGRRNLSASAYLPRSIQRMTAIAADPSSAKPATSGSTVPS